MGQALNADPLSDSVNLPRIHIQVETVPKNEATLIFHTNANIPKSSLSVYCWVLSGSTQNSFFGRICHMLYPHGSRQCSIQVEISFRHSKCRTREHSMMKTSKFICLNHDLHSRTTHSGMASYVGTCAHTTRNCCYHSSSSSHTCRCNSLTPRRTGCCRSRIDH